MRGGGGGSPNDEMTMMKNRPTKVQCSHSPGSLLAETQDEALDIGHCCNHQNNMNSVLNVLFDAFSQNVFHFSLILSHLTNWRTGYCYRMMHATVRHTCKRKSSGKLEFHNRHFIISGVLGLPYTHQNNYGGVILIPGSHRITPPPHHHNHGQHTTTYQPKLQHLAPYYTIPATPHHTLSTSGSYPRAGCRVRSRARLGPGTALWGVYYVPFVNGG